MKTNVTRMGFKGLSVLTLSLGAALPMIARAQAQPDPNNAVKGQNPPNRLRRNKNNRGQNGARAQARLMERELAAAEVVAGKPLTDDQKQKVRDNVTAREDAVRAAREKYVTDLAATLGMEPDEVRLKLREAQAKGRRQLNGGAMGIPAAGTATAPAG